MQVYKFGGASLRNVEAIRNMMRIVQNYGEKPLLIVVSAMGKTTRALEDVFDNLKNEEPAGESIALVERFHVEIIEELFENPARVLQEVQVIFKELRGINLDQYSPLKTYDHIVSCGEKLSSTIVSAFLNSNDLPAKLINAPEFVRTDSNYSFGKVDWANTSSAILENLRPVLDETIVVTQGYIGSDAEGNMVTLGKEGSDFSAAIFATCLGAENVTIWKDVPGVMNGDPKKVEDAVQIDHLPYREASEMTYYGASVIHPKTIKPLANKGITLTVRSFDDPETKPTIIGDFDHFDIPAGIIFKEDQCLISFRIKDLSFVNQSHMSRVFTAVEKLNLGVHMIQNSAVSISICFDYSQSRIDDLISEIGDEFEIHYNTNLRLLTIKNFNQGAIAKYAPAQDSVLMEQKTRDNIRYLIRKD